MKRQVVCAITAVGLLVSSVPASALVSTTQTQVYAPAEEAAYSDLVGIWRINDDLVFQKNGASVRQIFGSSIKYGDLLKIKSDGSFQVSVAVVILQEGKISQRSKDFIVVDTIDNYKQQSRTISLQIEQDEDGRDLLVLDYDSYKIYWEKLPLGTWGSAKGDNSYATSYKTIFTPDGRVFLYGYRNRDAGTYQWVDDHTIVATFTESMFDFPGYGYRKIERDAYQVFYTFDQDYNYLSVDYPKELEEADYSNVESEVLRKESFDSEAPDWAPAISSGVSPWAAAEVAEARENGLIPVQLDGNYQGAMTRQEFCQMAVKLVEMITGKSIHDVLDYCDIEVDDDFSDTKDPAVSIMSAFHVVFGDGDGRFNPNHTISREEAATMLTRVAKVAGAGLPEGASLSCADATSIPDWAYYSVMFVNSMKAENGNPIMGTTGNRNFNPKGSFSREQAFVAFARLFSQVKHHNIVSITTEKDINPQTINISSENGYLQGGPWIMDGLRTLWMVSQPSGENYTDRLIVKSGNEELASSDYEIWIRPFKTDIPIFIYDNSKIETKHSGMAIVTVQSPVSGIVWESFYVASADIMSSYLLGTKVPEIDVGGTPANFYAAEMYVDDYHVQPVGDKFSVSMKVYNQAAIYGSVDIYGADGKYIESKRINKHTVLDSSLKDVALSAYGLITDAISHDIFTYRQHASAINSEVSFEVPRGGYVVFSNNPNESIGAKIYNFSDLFVAGLKTTTSLADLPDKMQSEIVSTFSANLLQELKNKSSNATETALLELLSWANQSYDVGDIDAYIEEVVNDGLLAMQRIGIDAGKILMDCLSNIVGDQILSSVQDALTKAMGPAGEALNLLFTISDIGNYTVQLNHYEQSYTAKTIRIIYPTDDSVKSVSVQENLFALIPKEFTFASGGGAWQTTLTLQDDGSFTGEYTDSNPGECFISRFHGKFSEPQSSEPYVYTAKIESLELEQHTGVRYVKDGVQYITCEPYGLNESDIIYIYLPGTMIDNLPSEVLVSMNAFGYDRDADKLSHFAIYDQNQGAGFLSSD